MNPVTSPPPDDRPQCCFCGKPIGEGQWFARFRRGPRLVVFCRPFCVEAFLEQEERTAGEPAPATGGWNG